MHTHHVEPEIVMAFHDGQLAADEAAGIRAHLETCAECQAIVGELDEVSAHLRAWTVEEPSPKLAWRVAGAAGQRKGKFWWWHWPTAALVATAALVIAVLPARHESYAWKDAGQNRTMQVTQSYLPPPASAARPRRDSFMEVPRRAETRSSQRQGVVGGVPGGVDRLEAPGEAVPASAGKVPRFATELSGPMIARDASLAVTVKDFASVRENVERIVRIHRGFSQNLALTYQQGRNNLTATLRIPDPELDRALAELRALGTVDQESQNGEDLQAQHVDLAARIANSRVAEARLKELLANRTGKLSDVVEAEGELSRVREEIERMEAEIRTMENRVSLATINLHITDEPAKPAPASVWNELTESYRFGLRMLGEALLGAVVWLLEYSPTLLAVVLVFFFPVRWVWRLWVRKASLS